MINEASGGQGAAPDPTTGEQLVRAIQEHRVTSFVYQGLRRTVEPHLLGVHEAGEAVLMAHQTAGSSHRGDVPGWRTFIVAEINEVEVSDQEFPGPRPDFNPGNQFVEVFARA